MEIWYFNFLNDLTNPLEREGAFAILRHIRKFVIPHIFHFHLLFETILLSTLLENRL